MRTPSESATTGRGLAAGPLVRAEIAQWCRTPAFSDLAVVGATGDYLALGFVALGAFALREARARRRDRRTSGRARPPGGGRNRSPTGTDRAGTIDSFPTELLTKLLALVAEHLDEPHRVARLARAGRDDLEIVFSAPIEPLPRWASKSTLAQSVRVRRSTLAALEPPDRDRPAPLALPIGQNDQGTWAVVLQPGSSLALLGPDAPDLFSALASTANQHPWSSQVHLERARNLWRLSWLSDRPIGGAVARITNSASEPADTTILADHRGLTVHPDGLLLSRGADRSAAPEPECATLVPAGPERLSSGDLEVRLLTAVPRLEGLRAELPANRARRAIELIAYLAIHHPDPISSDRLRTRVLGGPEADAAAKTLFNTVAAARKALGQAPDGQPYLPNGSRHGRYVLSSRVTIDVQRALQLFVAAKSADSPDLALALYRLGFELIEGEPLAGSLSGYGWWRSEGHEARLSSATVAAAGLAVRLSIEQGLLELAWWILDQARLVEPFSEALSRAAMTIAAAAGDQARLRKEWDDCCRRVVELDPGASPSVETASLFHRLRQQ